MVGREERAGSGGEAAEAPAGDCGVEDQVGRTDSYPYDPLLRRVSAQPNELPGGHHGDRRQESSHRRVR